MDRSIEIASAKTPRNDGIIDRFFTREQRIEAFRMTVKTGKHLYRDGVYFILFIDKFFRMDKTVAGSKTPCAVSRVPWAQRR